MCEACGRSIGHDFRCSNYSPPKTVHYCSAYSDGILDEEEYIKNLDGEYRHYECFHGMREILEWLGCDIKMMNSID